MSGTCVAILHGWSDEGKSFQPLRQYLGAHGYDVANVLLGDYVSMDDDVRVEDVAKRMQAVVTQMLAQGRLQKPFNLIVHSTGALVARQWLAAFHPDGKDCPVQKLIMLAPANFGSKLAAVGKSMIGRLTKGLQNRLQTGTEMLNALELGSPYQWRLTQQDLLDATGAAAGRSAFGETKVWPFAIIGTRAYDEGVQQVVNENGSDGTVRVAAANPNCVGMTIDFTGKAPQVTRWGSRTGLKAPFAVLPERDHSEITHPEQDGQCAPAYAGRLGELILEALGCQDYAAYQGLERKWAEISNQTALLALTPAQAAQALPDEDPPPQVRTIAQVFGGRDRPDPAHFHRYLQLNVLVRDEYGNPIPDYFLEFTAPDRDDKSLVTFHREVLEAVHVNSQSGAYRCLYVDHTDLMRIFYDDNSELVLNVTSAAPGPNVSYFDAAVQKGWGQVALHASDLKTRESLDARLFRNRTHFIEIVIPRRPVDAVFRFL